MCQPTLLPCLDTTMNCTTFKPEATNFYIYISNSKLMSHSELICNIKVILDQICKGQSCLEGKLCYDNDRFGREISIVMHMYSFHIAH